MNTRVLLVASLLVLTGLAAVAPPASAMCYLDPDDPVPGVACGVDSTARCAMAVVKQGTCPV